MKNLFLIRHAKSDWSYEGLPDIDRPLNERGYRDAHFMSKQLRNKKLIPDAIITSSAIRTTSTALIFSRNLGFPENKLIICPDLYDASLENYMSVVSKIENRYNNVFIFSHNPTTTLAANALCGAQIDNLPTCGIVKIGFSTNSWAELTNGKLAWLDFPKNYSQS